MFRVFIEFCCTAVLAFIELARACVRAVIPDSLLVALIGRNLSGQVVLITGAGSGIGREVAVNMAHQGAVIVLLDVNEQGLQETKRLIDIVPERYAPDEPLTSSASSSRTTPSRAFAYRCNVSSKDDVDRVAQQVLSQVGSVDILINNAGIVSGKRFEDLDQATVERVMNVNCLAHFWIVRAYLPSMLERGSNNGNKRIPGHIVTVASMAGLFGASRLVDYCCSKYAALGFHEALQSEFHYAGGVKSRIRFTCVCPHYIRTGMFDGVKQRFDWLMPLTSQEDAARNIVNGIRLEKSYIIFPRVMWVFIALKACLPSGATRALADFFGSDYSMDSFVGRQQHQHVTGSATNGASDVRGKKRM